MADENLTYVSLIGQAIDDFDSIEAKLNNKFNSGSTKLKEDEQVPTSQLKDWVQKLTLIDLGNNNYLGDSSEDGDKVVSGILSTGTIILEGKNNTSQTSHITYDHTAKSVVIGNKLSENLYIEAGALLSRTITLTDLNLSGTLSSSTNNSFTFNEDTENNTYVFKPNDNNIVGSVTIAKASIGGGVETNSANITLESNHTVTDLDTVLEKFTQKENGVDVERNKTEILASTNIEAENKSRYYNFTVGNTSTVSSFDVTGSITHDVTTKGYLTESTINGDYSRSVEEHSVSKEKTFYIKKGGIKLGSLLEAEGNDETKTKISLSTSDDYSILLSSTEGKTEDVDYIKITPTLEGANLTFQAEIEEGYIKAATGTQGDTVTVNNLNISSNELLLKKAKVSGFTEAGKKELEQDLTLGFSYADAVLGSNAITDLTEDSDYFTFTVAPAANTAGTNKVALENIITDGFFDYDGATEKSEISINQSKLTKELYIKAAGGTGGTMNVKKYSESDTISSVKAETGDDKISVTITPELSYTASGQFTPGFVNAQSKINVTEAASVTPYTLDIKVGNATIKPASIQAIVHNIEDNKDAGTLPTGETGTFTLNNFLIKDADNLPNDKDYLEIKASSIIDFTSGFISGTTSENNGETSYYIPKATLEWVETETGEEGLRVATSGYLPTGWITELTTINDVKGYNAVVDFGFTTPTNSGLSAYTYSETLKDGEFVNPFEGASYTEFNIGLDIISAGYISDTTGGTNGHNEKLLIKNAKFLPSVTITANGKTDEDVEYDEETQKYVVQVGISATAGKGQTSAGVLTSDILNGFNYDDLTDEEKAIVKSDSTVKVELQKASFSHSKHDTTIGVDLGALASGDASNGYAINATLDAYDIEFSLTQAGYIAGEEKLSCKYDSASDEVEPHNLTPVTAYVKKADVSKIALSDSSVSNLTIQTPDDITLTDSQGQYNLEFGGSVTTKITTDSDVYGYIGQSEVGTLNSGTHTIDLTKLTTKSITINRAKVEAKLSVNDDNAITSQTANLVYNDAEKTAAASNHLWAEITTNTVISTSVDVEQDGYIKSTDSSTFVSGISGSAAAQTKAYVKKFERTTKDTNGDTDYSANGNKSIIVNLDTTNYTTTVGNKTDLDVETGVNSVSMIIPTAGTFMSKNLEVSIGDYAMGSQIESALKRLNARMLGSS